MLRRIRAGHVHTHGMTKLALLLIGGLYAASFFMPAFYVLTTPVFGWEAFYMAMASPFMALWNQDGDKSILEAPLVWFVNPLEWLGFYGIVRQKPLLTTA